ncbi:MAG TPA: FAD-dependent oxidoreductase, partial [Phycisphaerae bacterium]|nr:FAD-dependent oxidoreductase [Phycisphaerae bacterium]
MNASPDNQTVTWCRDLPVRYETDVAVIGGGIAGACAAAAAAAGGARVILVERFAVTGGMMTVGGVGNWCGQTRGQGEVFDEILSGLEAFGALGPLRQDTHGAESRIFDHEILAVVLQELLLRRGVKLLLHARFADARVRNGQITECAICGQSGLEALRARQFIDCTGEGQVARAAGLATMKGREPNGAQIAMSMMYFLRETPEPSGPQVPEGWFEAIRSPEELPMTSVWPNGPGGKALKVKVPGFDSSDTESMTAAEIHGRRRMMAVLDYYQRVENRPW